MKSGIFSVKNCINPVATANQSFGYSELEFETETEFGSFDLATGIFTFEKSGLYQLNFDSNIYTIAAGNFERRFELRVNGTMKAQYHRKVYDHYGQQGVHQPFGISSLMQLKSGDKVGVFAVNGALYEAAPNFVTRFTCVYLAEK